MEVPKLSVHTKRASITTQCIQEHERMNIEITSASNRTKLIRLNVKGMNENVSK